MSQGSYVGRIGSLSVHPRGSGAAVSGLLVLGALLALLVAAVPLGAVTRTVRVVAKSKSVGRVVAVIPVDDPLLNRLAKAAGVSAPDRLWVRVGSNAQNVRLGKAFDLVQGRKYRVFAAKL